MEEKIQTINNLADIVEQEIKKSNIEKWDLYLREEHIHGLYLEKTTPSLINDSHNLSYYIRVFENKNQDEMGVGLVLLNSNNPKIIQDGIKKAKIIANINISPRYELTPPGKKYQTVITTDKEVWESPKEFLMEKGKSLRRNLKEIMNAETTFAKFRSYKIQKMLRNSAGLNLIKPTTYFCYEFSIKAEKDGKKAEYWPKGYFKSIDQLKFDEFIPEWATLARDGLKAKIPETNSNIQVLFPPRLVRTALLSTIGYSATGQSLFEKTTPFQIGAQISDERLSVNDNSLIPGLLNSSAWDGEGWPKQNTKVIENGIMRKFLFDQQFASMLHETPTGNGTRNASGSIQTQFNNLIVSPGEPTLRDIVQDVKKGVYIIDFSWLNPNPITGMFGAEIRNGYMIENGELTTPIKGGNLSGNIYEMLNNIEEISKERRFVMNSQVPFILFKNLALSSE